MVQRFVYDIPLLRLQSQRVLQQRIVQLVYLLMRLRIDDSWSIGMQTCLNNRNTLRTLLMQWIDGEEVIRLGPVHPTELNPRVLTHEHFGGICSESSAYLDPVLNFVLL